MLEPIQAKISNSCTTYINLKNTLAMNKLETMRLAYETNIRMIPQSQFEAFATHVDSE